MPTRSSRFLTGASPLLLVTERFHFFRRLRIRGARHLLFYGPPSAPHFYPELVNSISARGGAGGVGAPTSTVLFTRLDAPALERIVGTARVGAMAAEGPKTSWVFV